MKRPPSRILVAAAIRDATGIDARPGAVAIQEGRIVAAGDPDEILNDPKLEPSAVRSLPGVVLIPALVNAHAHLELALLGPRPYDSDRGMVGWIEDLRLACVDLDKEVSATAGAVASLQAGVSTVGDIASTLEVAEAVWETGLKGRSFLELFGLGDPFDQPALQMIAQGGDFGLQPHAPYSAGPGVFDAAAKSDRPVCTHLAETLEEHRFVARADGPLRELVEQYDKWDDSFAKSYTGHRSSVQWMRPYLEKAPWLLAHCNYVSDEDLKLLAATGASVAYCPIASDYFGHTSHRYRDMLKANINVCLGTDSMVCQPRDEEQPFGILPQMRYLFERDRVEPQTLLKMATVNGIKALQLPAHEATLQPGATAHLLAVPFNAEDETDPLKQILKSPQKAEIVSV